MWDAVITVFINVLLYIYDFVGNNFGLAIIVFTLLIRLIELEVQTDSELYAAPNRIGIKSYSWLSTQNIVMERRPQRLVWQPGLLVPRFFTQQHHPTTDKQLSGHCHDRLLLACLLATVNAIVGGSRPRVPLQTDPGTFQ